MKIESLTGLKRTVLLAAITIIFSAVHAQYIKPGSAVQPDVNVQGYNQSTVRSVSCMGLYSIDPNAPVWVRTLTGVSAENETVDPEAMEALKKAKIEEKRRTMRTGGNPVGAKASKPVVKANFAGNAFNFGTPLDNTVAISNGGIVVSAINSTINYYSSSGSLLSGSSFNSLINNPSLNGKYFDPKVLYDSGSDRFIFVILHDSDPSTSRVLIGFSKSNNPTAGWWIYNLPGDILNDNSWFDYPHIAVSNDELFITGNLFSSADVFRQSVVIQLEKIPAYSGGTISYQSWDNISGNPFTLLPVSYGQQGNYGPGIYLVSSFSGSGNNYSLYDITDNLSGSPSIVRSIIPTPFYSAPADAIQKGSSDKLKTGGCRLLSGFYLNNVIHFVHNVDVGSGWSGIRYNRMNVVSKTNSSSEFGNQGVSDYAYPAVASYGSSSSDQSVMISYETSSSSSFPGVAVVNCDHTMTWSTPTTVRSGNGFVSLLSGDERWGDYTGMARKHNGINPTVWLSAAYGDNSNAYSTWIAEVNSVPEPVPVVSFSGTPLSGQVPLTVTFTDNSTGATTRKWTFPGGNPATSTAVSPAVVYQNSGTYDVTLEVSNSSGTDTETKTNYIDAQISTVGIAVNEADQSAVVYPNPVIDYFTVEFEMPEKTNVQVRLLDVRGKLVKELYNGWGKSGTNRFSFMKNALSPGIYFLQINSSEKQIVNEKIVIGA